MEPFNWISNVPEISYNHLICTTQLLINPIEKNMLKCQSEKPLTISLSFKYAYNQWLSVSVGQTRQRDCLLFTSVWIELQKCPFEPHFCDLNVNKMRAFSACHVCTNCNTYYYAVKLCRSLSLKFWELSIYWTMRVEWRVNTTCGTDKHCMCDHSKWCLKSTCVD